MYEGCQEHPTSKRETSAEPDLPRCLDLWAGQDLRCGLAEVWIRSAAERQRREVIVALHDLLIEEIEDVRDQRQAPITSKFQIIGSLEVDLVLERRSRHESIDRLNAAAARGRGNFTTVAVHRASRQRRQRRTGSGEQRGAQIEVVPHVLAVHLELVRSIERQDPVGVAEELDVSIEAKLRYAN